MSKVVKLPVLTPSADAAEHARAETQRKQRLFGWADRVLKQLGLNKAVKDASSIEALYCIALDVESADVIMAIRDALHPAGDQRPKEEHFRGLNAAGLKVILRNRFAEMKRTQEKELRHRRGKEPLWEDGLILDKEHRIRPILANLILILTHGPDWKGALAYDEFNARPVALTLHAFSIARVSPRYRFRIVCVALIYLGIVCIALIYRCCLIPLCGP
jgi:hypothetical protein